MRPETSLACFPCIRARDLLTFCNSYNGGKIPNSFSYELVEGWEQLPEGYQHLDIAGVACAPDDRVFLLTRNDARAIVYEPDGTFVRSWGEDIFTPRTHGITIDRDGFVYTSDDGDHTVRKFTPEGEQLMVLGTPGVPSKTGYIKENGIGSIKFSGPPFNRPTGVAVARNGDIFVCDGYGNARIHRFSADGKLLHSWGDPGFAPGQFYLPHGICIDANDRLLVADRENDFNRPSLKFMEK